MGLIVWIWSDDGREQSDQHERECQAGGCQRQFVLAEPSKSVEPDTSTPLGAPFGAEPTEACATQFCYRDLVCHSNLVGPPPPTRTRGSIHAYTRSVMKYTSVMSVAYSKVSAMIIG